MAYERHIWQCGEPVTDGKLNHMEDGDEIIRIGDVSNASNEFPTP